MNRRSQHTDHQPLTTSHYRRRRGVLLLVVLSLLVLFAMITVTFVLVAGQYRRMSRAAGKVELVGDDPSRQLDEAFAQTVRDTKNPRSSLFGHSLLADIYGNDGLKISNVGVQTLPVGSDQLIDIHVTLPPPGTRWLFWASPGVVGNPEITLVGQLQSPGYFNGCLLTFLDGGAANRSARIVGWGYSAATPAYTIRIMAGDGITLPLLSGDLPRNLLINGRAFNGTGFGFDVGYTVTQDTYVKATDSSGMMQAHSVNPRYFQAGATYFSFGGVGGADEDYDAADLQNMLLSYLPLRDVALPSAQVQDVIPSLHRPDLLSFLNPGVPLDTLRKAMLRPIGPMKFGGNPYVGGADHPNFTGSNPLFDAAPFAGMGVEASWDVDNDGDGVAESVWIDIGLPVQTAPDGRRFKPLVAILCNDLDGRLNVNAHGNYAQTDTAYSATIAGTGKINNYLWNTAGTPVAQPTLARGSGYGPADVNLGVLFPVPGYYSVFMNGTTPVAGGSSFVREGRYGDFGGGTSTAAGRLTAGTAGPDDVLGQMKHADIPLAYNYYTWTTLTNFASPCDFAARAALGIDFAGQPMWSFYRSNSPDTLGTADAESPNDPYTLNLSLRRPRSGASGVSAADDNPFTPGELERLLRMYDIDAKDLPDRLQYLLDPGKTSPYDLARMITTDSFDVPTPAVMPTRDMRERMRQQRNGTAPAKDRLPDVQGLSITDLLRSRMVEHYGNNLTQANLDTINTQIIKMLPAEMLAGEKFDLNRPFGNGRDDNTDNVVDEIGENETEYWNSANPNMPAAFRAVLPQYTNGEDVNGNGLTDDARFARQQYARYLYLLMMMFADRDFAWTSDSAIDNATKLHELTARRIAQWAINVVDFRDADAIMTPFEYDVNPFNQNGWSVDGDLTSVDGPDRRVVWGVEYPDLLLTETLAFHDRRVEDRNTDPSGKYTTDMTAPDQDYDQIRIPEGSLFLELYCPRNGNPSERGFPPELYSKVGNQWRLDLGRLAPPGGGVAYPVWRIALTGSTVADPNNGIENRLAAHPDVVNFDPAPTNDLVKGSVFEASVTGAALPPIQRYVWLADVPPTANHPDYDRVFYNTGGNEALLNPGQYAVVGPRPQTYVGKPPAGPNTGQRIELYPTAPSNQVAVFNTASVATVPPSADALAIICTHAHPPTTTWPFQRQIGMNVSEPMPIYNMGVFVNNSYYTAVSDANGTLVAPSDKPLDGSPVTPANLIPNAPLAIESNWMTSQRLMYAGALLQRLANPTQPFDPVINPYITVDWQSIDLTVFNGETLQGNPAGSTDMTDPAFAPNPPAVFTSFGPGSRERGPLATNSNLWHNHPQQPQTVPANKGISGAIFDYPVANTLGYVNKSMGPFWAAAPVTTPKNYGYVNAPDPTQTPKPFSWITWNNRPYANAMELLLVPPYSAEEMLRNFSTPAPSPPYVSPYDNANAPTAFRLPFGHLFNFFLSADGHTPGEAPYFYRFLDFIHVPSRFVGTENHLMPAPLANPLPAGPPTNLTESQLGSFLHPPFNRVASHREPGRVNINTIPGPPGNALTATTQNPIWNAILNGGPGPTWAQVVASRRGEKVAPGTVPTFNVTTYPQPGPAYFANPFRTAAGASLRLPGTIPNGASAGELVDEIDVTLMRAIDVPDLADTAGPIKPLFDVQAATGFTPQPYADPDRNAYFRYQPFTRLANTLTTKSNVYAIWITVGYFEVTPWDAPPQDNIKPDIDFAHPDGWQLGAEIGSDSGEVKRHRAFYIYDRSIPVGFEPGRDHNFQDGVLVKRYIE
ncbi:MAG: hypothetical protein AB7O59_23700 [Pirellulales bacterium]